MPLFAWRSPFRHTRLVSLALGRWSLLSTVLLAAIVVPFFLYEEPITCWTQEFIERQDSRWVVGGALGGLLATDLLLPIPSSLVSIAAGYVLGFWKGSAVIWIGMTAACLIGYLLGATAGREVTRRFVGEKELQRASHAQTRFGDWVVVVFRAVPVLAEASVLFAGVARMPFARFVAPGDAIEPWHLAGLLSRRSLRSRGRIVFAGSRGCDRPAGSCHDDCPL